MRVLHLADLHIGKKVHGYSMLDEQKNILCNQIINIIINNNIEVIFIAGDIYDTAIPSGQAVLIFDTFLTKICEMKIKTYIIPGNHDSEERISFASELLKKNNVYISKPINYKLEEAILEKYEEMDEFGKINIYLMPYLRNTDISKIIDNTKINENERNILIAHQFVTATNYITKTSDSEIKSVGGVEDVDGQIFEKFDYVALGHLHAPQHIGRETIRYAGSILKYSFSEVDQKKSYLILDFKEKGKIDINKVPIEPINDMRKICGPIEKLLSKEVYSEGNVNDYIHATITNNEEVFDAMRKLKDVYCNLLKLDFDNSRTRAFNEVEKIENIEKKSEIQLFEEFYTNRTDEELTDKERKVMKKIIDDLR